MALMFWPRGGSAQVVRYLAPALDLVGWPVRLVAGSRGGGGGAGNAKTIFRGLDGVPPDYSAALGAAEGGVDPMDQPVPLHPSFEDRAGAPDRIFVTLDDSQYERQAAAWQAALQQALEPSAQVLHLHHLTPAAEAATRLDRRLPVLAHLHGTE